MSPLPDSHAGSRRLVKSVLSSNVIAMRFLTLIFVLLLGMHTVDGADDNIVSAIKATVRALCADQRVDGAWTDPDSVVRVTVVPPPPMKGEPVQAPPGAADRFRPWVGELSAAAEGLLLVAKDAPEGRPVAEKALRLAAQALMADRFNEISLDEAIPFLRAAALVEIAQMPDVQAAVLAAKQVYESPRVLRTIGTTVIGFSDLSDRDHIDLRLTWQAGPLIRHELRSYLPSERTAGQPRVARRQQFLAPVQVDRSTTIPAAEAFEDATLFAAALGRAQRDRDWNESLLTWIRPLCELELSAESDPDLLEAAAEVLVSVPGDGDESWWNGRLRSWTNTFLAGCERRPSDRGERMDWRSNEKSKVLGNAFGLRWLARVRSQELTLAMVRFEATNIAPRVAALAALQREDGTWNNQDDQRDMTAMAMLALVINGYEHLTPNPYQQCLERGVQALMRRCTDMNRPLYDQALDALVLLEVYGMTMDRQLKDLGQEQISRLMAAQRVNGGWPDEGNGDLDWSTTVMMMQLVKTAQAVGLQVPMKDLAAWWFSRLDDEPQTSAIIRMKAVGVVFLEGAHPNGKALATTFIPKFDRLLEPVADGRGWAEWQHALVLFFRQRPGWEAWRNRRLMCLPGSVNTHDGIGSLMADVFVLRDVQMRR